jgi:hypothetical protein
VQGTGDAESATTDVDAQITPSGTAPVFLPVGGTATSGAVAFVGSWTDKQKVHVEIAVKNFKDLFGIAGHVHYDPAVLQLTLLQANAVPLGDDKNTSDYKPRAVAKEAPTGRILLGGARFSNVPSPFDTPYGAKVTKETWLVLEFDVLKKADTVIAFDPNTLVVRNGAYTDVPTDWGHLEIVWQNK